MGYLASTALLIREPLRLSAMLVRATDIGKSPRFPISVRQSVVSRSNVQDILPIISARVTYFQAFLVHHVETCVATKYKLDPEREVCSL